MVRDGQLDEVLSDEGANGNGRQRQVRRRQQEILDAAAEIFREKGYEATSTQDIAEAVGLLKGSLYYYIDSKEDLLFAIIDEAYKGALQTLELSKAAPGDVVEKIRQLIENHVTYFTTNQVKMAVLFRDFRSLSEERQRIIAGEGDQYLEEVRSLIRQGQDEGVVAGDIDPRLASISITGMVNSLAQWYDPLGPSSPAEIAAAFSRLVVGGLVPGAVHAAGAVQPGDTTHSGGATHSEGATHSRGATQTGGKPAAAKTSSRKKAARTAGSTGQAKSVASKRK